MATYKTCLQSETEIQHMLEEIGSERDDVVSSESDKSSESEVTVTVKLKRIQ